MWLFLQFGLSYCENNKKVMMYFHKIISQAFAICFLFCEPVENKTNTHVYIVF